MKWHTFRFRINWPENEHPKWWIDIFIVDTIIRDVLNNYGNKLSLWRFHRRADRDESGHQLSLLCYTEDENAPLIDDSIKKNDFFNMLNSYQMLREYFHETGSAKIEDTSDKTWAKEIKKTWPYFIYGVSEMLLNLYELIRQDVLKNLDTSFSLEKIEDVEKLYMKIDERITILWQQQGSHAFFHHINALFGYTPLLAQPRNFAGILASF